MLTTSLRRSAALGALACALLGAGSVGVAAAQSEDPSIARARAQERYYAYGDSEAVSRKDAETRRAAARQQVQYYASYGEPEPIVAPAAPAPDDDSPWLIIAPALFGALVAGGAIAAVMWRRRLRIRRRAVGAAT